MFVTCRGPGRPLGDGGPPSSGPPPRTEGTRYEIPATDGCGQRGRPCDHFARRGRRRSGDPFTRRDRARAHARRTQQGHRAEGGPPARQDDPRGEAPAAAAPLRRPGHRRGRPQRRRRGLQPHRPGQDQPPPAGRDVPVAAEDPDPVRLRHHSRLPDDLPHPARRGQQLRPVCRDGGRHDRRPRDRHRRHQADLRADGRRLPRAAMGPHRRGRRRGPVPGRRVRRREGEGLPGLGLLQARQGDRQPQARRRVRPARGRPRLQHDRHVRGAAAQSVPAALPGRDRRRRRHRDVLVQRDQRRPRLREPPHRDGHHQGRVGLRRLHRERLHRRRRAPRLPAGHARRGPVRPRRRRRRPQRRRARHQRGHRLGDGEHQPPRLRRAAGPQRRDPDVADQRRGPAHPARQVPRRPVRPPLRGPGEGRRPGVVRDARRPRRRPLGRRAVDGAAQERRRSCRSTPASRSP